MKILVVEDDELDALQTVQAIEKAAPGAALRLCPTADAALAALAEDAMSPPDFIIVDQHLPGVDGAEFLRRVKRLGLAPAAQFLMLTGDASDPTRAEALVTDFHAFLTKPVSRRRLSEILRTGDARWEIEDLPLDLNLYRKQRPPAAGG
ncbi:response regulator [Rhodovulum sp. DZ06]|uniref:response regulator n=1 Tax=Rhodovulum sp. DZ06 TaxID=3425126 RepID=UPI003D345B7F